MSRDNRDPRPPLRASELPAWQVRLIPGQPRKVACPDCGYLTAPQRGHVIRHDRPGGETAWERCPGSGRAVWFDISPLAWWVAYAAGAREASSRSGRWSYRQVGAGRPAGRRYAGPSGSRPPLLSAGDVVLARHAAERARYPDGGRRLTPPGPGNGR